MLAAKSSVGPACAGPVDQPLAVEEPERQLLVVCRGAHRHRQRGAVHPYLQRLLDHDLVAAAVVDDAHQRSRRERVGGFAHAPARAGVAELRSGIGRTSTATTLYSGQDVFTSAEAPTSRFVLASGKWKLVNT